MALLSSVTLENVRTFRRRTTLDLAPLTLITGPNSSGKSTVIKALQLLRHNAALGRLHRPTFAGGYHNLGSFESARSRGSDRTAVTVGVSFDWGEHESGETDWQGHDGSDHFSEFEVGDINAEFRYEETDLAFRSAGMSADESRRYVEPGYQLSQFRLGRGKGGGEPLLAVGLRSETVTLDVEYTEDVGGDEVQSSFPHEQVQYHYAATIHGDWLFEDEDEAYLALGFPSDRPADAEAAARWLSRPLDIRIRTLNPYGDAPTLDALVRAASTVSDWSAATSDGDLVELDNPYLAYALRTLVHPYLLRWTRYFSEQIAALDHTGALRATPQRLYPDDADDPFTRLLYAYTRPKRPDDPIKRSRLAQLPALLQEYGLGDGLRVERVADAAYAVQVLRGDQAVHLADLGYGFSQLLPLLLYAVHVYGVEEWFPTLLVEEPEANLHPNLQARLADLLVQLTEPISGHVLAETHSEYLVRRLQYLVATGAADPERAAIYYLGPDPEADDYVCRITISPEGRLSEEFGPGFLDEATSLMVSLFQAGSQN